MTTKKMITLTPDKKLNQAIWWVFQELRKEHLAVSSEKSVSFEYCKRGDTPSLEDQRRALKFLSGNGMIRITNDNYPAPFNQYGGGGFGARVLGVKPIGHDIDILQPKFDKFYRQVSKMPEIKALASISSGYLIDRDSNGNYFYNGKRIEMNREAIYYKIFDALYLRGNQDGFLSYEDIENHLIKNGVSTSNTKAERNKRILNAITNKQQGLFRTAKVSGKGFLNKTPDGGKLIDPIRGDGLRLNNPKI
ncbi:MAG: hypothetical protein A2939_01920 [Parcubacteria group bacterium RIFCSPLOWO2_01_FULL_48_18]|nr:MAG: hypothetical protein A2939_01920 [Parcubacteria group bacterium RIFCSPLOWO2_01_FULL_48_18]